MQHILTSCTRLHSEFIANVGCRDTDYQRPLLDDEKMERESLISDNPFKDWMRRDFNAFIRACEKHGRTNMDAIAKEVESKSEEEVRSAAQSASDSPPAVNACGPGADRVLKPMPVPIYPTVGFNFFSVPI